MELGYNEVLAAAILACGVVSVHVPESVLAQACLCCAALHIPYLGFLCRATLWCALKLCHGIAVVTQALPQLVDGGEPEEEPGAGLSAQEEFDLSEVMAEEVATLLTKEEKLQQV